MKRTLMDTDTIDLKMTVQSDSNIEEVSFILKYRLDEDDNIIQCRAEHITLWINGESTLISGLVINLGGQCKADVNDFFCLNDFFSDIDYNKLVTKEIEKNSP